MTLTTSGTPAAPAPTSVVWSVGEVARSLDVPASTLRTWERRYGLAPSVRTQGGHRRYDATDVERIRLMHHLVTQGVAPAEAAKAAARVSLTHNMSDGAATAWLDQVVTAAREFNSRALVDLLRGPIVEFGLVTAWTEHHVPALQRVGQEWSEGRLGVDSEHLVTESMLIVLRSHLHNLDILPSDATILLASAEEEQHALPILALQGSLAESGVAAHALGPRLPSSALANIAARTRPRVVFVWASIPRDPRDRSLRVLAALASTTHVLLGGPGWDGIRIPNTTRCRDLQTTLATILERVA